MAICDWPETERPREKLLSKGASNLSDAELLAIFLRTGTRGLSAIDLSRALLQHYGSLKALLSADVSEFCKFNGMGKAKYAQLHASLELSKRFFEEEMQSEPLINNPKACQAYLKHALGNRPYETFAILYLDTQHRVLKFEELFTGTLDAAAVYPREVVRKVIDQCCAAVVLCHNHPSGSVNVSDADRDITLRLQEALALVDVKVLDHLIIANNKVVSFAEHGLL